jgi:ankyrin repeat protein
MENKMKILKSTLLVAAIVLAAISTQAQEIFDAAKTGDLAKVKELIEANPQLVNAKDSSGRTPLHWANRGVHLDVVNLLIDKGADVNAKDVSGTTPLFSAAANSHLDACKLLIDKGATVDVKNGRGSTPFYFAAHGGNKELLDLLLAAGAKKADLEIRNPYGRTPLCAVARDGGNAETIKVLIGFGANINAEDDNGLTPIMLAAWRPHEDVVNVLLDAGAELNSNDPKGDKLLTCAAGNGLEKLFDKLLEKKASLNILNEDGGTLLHSAAGGGSSHIVELLINQKFDPNKKDKFDWVPLHLAAEQGHKEIIFSLLKNGANINARNSLGQTPYNIAQERDDADLMNFLKSMKADTSPQKFPKITGKYLGCPDPGLIPKAFGLGIISHRYKPHSTIAVSPKGDEIFWDPMITPRRGGYSYGYIMTTRIENGKWTLPKKVSFSEKVFRDDHPVFSADGKRLYFASSRPIDQSTPTQHGIRIWYVEKIKSGWSEPKLFDLQPMPTATSEMFFSFSFDKVGNYYFINGRDIYCANFSGGKYSAPEKLSENINTGELIGCPYISPAGDYLLYHKGKSFISFRNNDGTWSEGFDISDKFGRVLNYSFSGNFIITGFAGCSWVSAEFIEELRPKNN